jgi:hypothetical protein|tara:strand:- start:1634 stop:1756 length:123 start_codon:yes stop_codon:yes gene_type:complete
MRAKNFALNLYLLEILFRGRVAADLPASALASTDIREVPR